jgi:hypothetical protein
MRRFHRDPITFAGKLKNATHDPSAIWPDSALKPFGPPSPSVQGADISEYRAKTNGVEWVLSQILSEDCSLQLCPARLALIENGRSTVVVDDMMHIGGPFKIEGNRLRNRSYLFKIERGEHHR